MAVNAAPAVATLTVLAIIQPPPTLAKGFNPTTINAGGVSTLTITLNNPSPLVATLTAPLIDTLPTGVLVAPVPNVSDDLWRHRRTDRDGRHQHGDPARRTQHSGQR